MIMCIISTIFGVLGIVGYYFGTVWLLYLGGAFTVLENLRGFITGQLKTLSVLIFSAFTGWCLTHTFNGICLGICFENVICGILGMLFTLFLICIAPKKEIENIKNEKEEQ